MYCLIFYTYMQYFDSLWVNVIFSNSLMYLMISEVARTRLRQEGSKYKGFWQTLNLVLKEEGLRGVYRGLCTQLVRQIPNTAIMMSTYELVVYLCNIHFYGMGRVQEWNTRWRFQHKVALFTCLRYECDPRTGIDACWQRVLVMFKTGIVRPGSELGQPSLIGETVSHKWLPQVESVDLNNETVSGVKAHDPRSYVCHIMVLHYLVWDTT